MHNLITAAGAALAAVFICGAADCAARYESPPTMVDAVSGPGRCVILVGDAERPCSRVTVKGPHTDLRIVIEAEGGGLSMSGAISGEMGDIWVKRMDYGSSRGAPVDGSCEFVLSGRDPHGIDHLTCETRSAFGQIRVRYAEAP